MPKEELLEFPGVVSELLPNATFRVKLENEHEIIAHTAGRMRKNRILIDGNVGDEGILLQIFTENMFGPIFFEIIQRKGNEGFGNGNFQALYESIELDQIRRGVITVDE